jgi:hypothetical protein
MEVQEVYTRLYDPAFSKTEVSTRTRAKQIILKLKTGRKFFYVIQNLSI